MLAWTTAALAADSAEAPIPSLADAERPGFARIEPPASGPGGTLVVRGATIWTGTGQILTDAWISAKDGRIDAMGTGSPPNITGALVVDAAARIVTPGLIDTHSHLGVYPSPEAGAHEDGNEMTAPTTPGVWAEHSFWPQDPGIERAVAGGVTLMGILPGSANLVGGRGVILRPLPARGARALRLEGAPEIVKMACGENPKRVYGGKGQAPSTRMGNLRGQREAFLEAGEYLRDWREYQIKLDAYEEAQEGKKKKKSEDPGEPPRPPARDLDRETLAAILEGRALAEVHCYRADDMLSFLQLADEFGFTVRSFHHALEAYKIRDILADRDVAVSTWADWWGFKMESYDGIRENAALVHEAGGRAIIHSDSPIGIQRLNQEAGKALAAGIAAGIAVGPADALAWITANPAWALGVEDQVGTLEVGKRADLVIWSADPFSVYAKADQVFFDGTLRYDARKPEVWSDFEVGQGLDGL